MATEPPILSINAISLIDFDLPEEMRKAMIGFHAFTGNDYVSAFFRKGKNKCWQLMISNEEYIKAFTELGDEWDVSAETFNVLEKFVCRLYQSRKREVNLARHELFLKKYTKENKVIDLALLPPCYSTLSLHIDRASYVSCMWKKCTTSKIDFPPVFHHGWNINYEVEWIKDAFPEDVSLLLINEDDDIEEIGTDDESDGDED